MTRTLLLVDDDDDIREVAQLSLELCSGWSVITARSGSEWIALATDHLPDAILLDVMMPTLDGPATLARLRADERTRHIPVIFLTAKARPGERDRLSGLGVAGVLSKPFDPVTLPDQVRDVLHWTG